MPLTAQDIRAARLHLQKNDPTMKRIIKQVGPCTLKTKRNRFQTLVQSIISQQISGAAAKTIFGRLLDVAGEKSLTPQRLAEFDVELLRSLGVSRSKANYLLDLTEKTLNQTLDLKSFHKKDDAEILQQLTAVKGIGTWTAQMFLMFSLGRLDILPTGDLGVQKAITTQYELRDLPSARKIEKIAKPWRPYATIACWYLWRSTEEDDW